MALLNKKQAESATPSKGWLVCGALGAIFLAIFAFAKVKQDPSVLSSKDKEIVRQYEKQAALNKMCFQFGYSFGISANSAMYGLPINSRTDVAVPPECRGLPETERGIREATEFVKLEMLKRGLIK